MIESKRTRTGAAAPGLLPMQLRNFPFPAGKELDDKLAEFLNQRGLQGVRFVPVRFTPNASVFKGEPCGGVNIIITDRVAFRPLPTGIEMALALRKLYPADFKIGRITELLVNQAAFDGLMAGKDPRRIAQDWQEELEKFEVVRKKYLIY